MRFPRFAVAAVLAAATALTTGLLPALSAQADQNTLPRTDFYDSPSPLLRVSEAFLRTMTFGQEWGWSAGNALAWLKAQSHQNFQMHAVMSPFA